MSETIQNKVATSGLVSIDLEEYYQQGARLTLKMDDFLFEGMILKEKDYRLALDDSALIEKVTGKFVHVIKSEDAIVPTWAYMLIVSKLMPYAKRVIIGSAEQLEIELFKESLQKLNPESFNGQRLVIKGCSNINIPEEVYAELTFKLQGVAKSIMFGEPCSTVPIYKLKGEAK